MSFAGKQEMPLIGQSDAIRVLRRLDALGPAPAVPAAGPSMDRGSTPWTRHPAVLGATGAGLLVFGVILGLLVSRYSTPAPPEPTMALPGPGSAPAPMMPGAGGGAPRPLPKEVLQGMLQAAHASLDAGRYQEAIAAYTAVLKRDPRNGVYKLMEVNVFSPGGLQTMRKLYNVDFFVPIIEALERKAAVRTHYRRTIENIELATL